MRFIAAVFLLAACKETAQAQSKREEAPAPPPPAPVPASASTSPAPPPPAPAIEGPELKKTHVLHIGDSFTHAHFHQNLAPRFARLGVRYEVRAQTSTYTTTWAFDGSIETYLWSKPHLVLITLGANEFEMPDAQQHAKAVKALVTKVGKVAPCVWITPPSWKPSTGIIQVIKDNAAPCLVFDSDTIGKVERGPDNVHPNPAGGAFWASAFWDWLARHRDPSKGPWYLAAEAPAP